MATRCLTETGAARANGVVGAPQQILTVFELLRFRCLRIVARYYHLEELNPVTRMAARRPSSLLSADVHDRPSNCKVRGTIGLLIRRTGWSIWTGRWSEWEVENGVMECDPSGNCKAIYGPGSKGGRVW